VSFEHGNILEESQVEDFQPSLKMTEMKKNNLAVEVTVTADKTTYSNTAPSAKGKFFTNLLS